MKIQSTSSTRRIRSILSDILLAILILHIKCFAKYSLRIFLYLAEKKVMKGKSLSIDYCKTSISLCKSLSDNKKKIQEGLIQLKKNLYKAKDFIKQIFC